MKTSRFTISAYLVQKRGSAYAYGYQNSFRGIWGCLKREGPGAVCWGWFGVMPPGLGLSAGKDAVIMGQIALFGYRRHCPSPWSLGQVFSPVSSPNGLSITVGLSYPCCGFSMFEIWRAD